MTRPGKLLSRVIYDEKTGEVLYSSKKDAERRARQDTTITREQTHKSGGKYTVTTRTTQADAEDTKKRILKNVSSRDPVTRQIKDFEERKRERALQQAGQEVSAILDKRKQDKTIEEQLAPLSGYEQRIQNLKQRETNLQNFKNWFYEKTHLKSDGTEKWYNPKGVLKALGRAPVEIASAPVLYGGRVGLWAESLFRKGTYQVEGGVVKYGGRQELKNVFKETPGAVASAYVYKDPETGKRRLTAQNVVNIGLTGLMFRSAVKSKYNPGVKAKARRLATTQPKSTGTYKGVDNQALIKRTGTHGGAKFKETTFKFSKSRSVTKTTSGKHTIYSQRTGNKVNYKIYRGKKLIEHGSYIDKPLNIKTKVTGVSSKQKVIGQKDGIGTTKATYKEQVTTNLKGKETNFYGQHRGTATVKGKTTSIQSSDAHISQQQVSAGRYVSGRLEQGLTKYKAPELKFSTKKVSSPPDQVGVKQLNVITAEKGILAQPRAGIVTHFKDYHTFDFTTTPPPNKPLFMGKKATINAGLQLDKTPQLNVQVPNTPRLSDGGLTLSNNVLNIPTETQAGIIAFPSFSDNVDYTIKTDPIITPIVNVDYGQRYKPDYNIKSFTDVAPDVVSASSIRQTPKSKTSVRAITSQVQIQSVVEQPAQVQIQTPVTVATPVSITQPAIFRPQPSRFRVPPPFVGFKLPKLPLKSVYSPGYDVFARFKGTFKKLNTQPLKKPQAINLGALTVGTSASATFKLENAFSPATGVFSGKGNLSDFYKKDNLFIEKKKRRIKSFGELQQITFKGLQAKKNKRRSKK